MCVLSISSCLAKISGPQAGEPGATVVLALIRGGQALIAHLGDSRAYLVRGETCQQLTADHSRVGEMLRLGLLSPDQAANHPGRSMLTRTIGLLK